MVREEPGHRLGLLAPVTGRASVLPYITCATGRSPGVRSLSRRFGEELLQLLKHAMVRSVMADVLDIDQFFKLLDHLFQPFIFLHPQPDSAAGGVTERHAEDAVHVEYAPGEETG